MTSMARPGNACPGEFWRVEARPAEASRGESWCGEAPQGMERGLGAALRCLASPGRAAHGMGNHGRG
jgi:hypothetical protein